MNFRSNFIVLLFLPPVGYALLGIFSQIAVIPPLEISALWLPAGWSIVCVSLFGYRVIAPLFLGAWVWNSLSIGIAPAALIAMGQCLQATIFAKILWKIAATDPIGDYPRGKEFVLTDAVPSAPPVPKGFEQLFKLPLSALLAFCISPTFGTFVLIQFGLNQPGQALEIWRSWFSGDILGFLIVAPIAFFIGRRLKLSGAKNVPGDSQLLILVFLALGPLIGALHWTLEQEERGQSALNNLLQDAITLIIVFVLPFIGILISRLRNESQGLTEQKTRLTLIVNTVQNGISLHDFDGTLLFANQSFLNIYLSGRENKIPSSFFSFFSETDALLMKNTFLGAANNPGLPLTINVAIAQTEPTEKQQFRKEVEVTVCTAPESEKNPHLVCVTRDVTRRNQAIKEKAIADANLANSESNLRSIVDSSPSIVFKASADQNLRFTFISGPVLKLFGFSPDECLGNRWWYEHVASEDRGDLIDKFCGHQSDVPMTCDFRMRLRSHHVRWFQSVSILVTNPFTETKEIVGHIRDIDNERRVAESVKASQRLETIGQLTGGLAHDFNNLLGVVVGNLDVLADKLPQDDQARHAHQNALQAALRGAEVTRSLLAVARRQPLEIVTQDLNAIMAEMLPLIRSSAGSAITVRSQLSPGELMVPLDPSGLSNAVLNLVINARDAMRDQTSQRRINLRTQVHKMAENNDLSLRPGVYASLEIQDNGPGMSEEVRARAFEPFFTTKTRGHGTGLGLAMVRGFAEQLGGTVLLDSNSEGTKVRLIIPAVDQ